MESFTYEELKMLLVLIDMEIMRRENSEFSLLERLAKFKDLYQKVYNLTQDMKNND